jgi:Sap, sulfolipid-1-addressing protein
MQFDLELLVLAILSAFWPTLVLVDVIAFQTRKPERILLGFLAGGLIATVTIGSLVVFSIDSTSIGSSSTSSTPSAIIDFTIAGFAFLCAWILSHRPDKPKKPPSAKKQARAEKTKQAIEKGAPLAFVAGILLNIVPGVFPIIALKNIAGADYSDAEVVATLFVFYVIMFSLVELPIIGYVFAEDWTGTQVGRFNTWLTNNRTRVAVWVLVGGGIYLSLRGVYAVVT